MEAPLRTSSYLIPVKLESEPDKYMLIHGYTGAIDIATESLVLEMLNGNINSIPHEAIPFLRKRGYLTDKTKEEEISYVERMAHALHERDKILDKCFTWVVTYNCNFRCPYCFENREIKDSSKGIVFTRELVDRTFNAMKEIEPRMQLQSPIITLYGGEPLLKGNRDIVEYIVQEGKKRGYKFHAITNGYDLDSYIDLLAPDLICQLQITIDGTKEHHNQKRKHFEDSNSFDKIISNIQLIFTKHLDVDIHIRINVDNDNWNDWSDLRSYFTEIGFLSHNNFKMYTALTFDNNEVRSNDEVRFLSESEYVGKLKKTNTISFCSGYNSVYRRIKSAFVSKKSIPLSVVHCSAQTGGYVFTPLKEIYPCWEVVGNKNFQIGFIGNDSIRWNKNELEKWHSYNISSSSCKRCKYAFLCGGVCLAMKENHCTLFHEIIKKASNAVFDSMRSVMLNN